MSKLFVIMGKSATGKDTLFKKLKEYHGLSLKSVVGYTTRPIRDGEREGEAYYFVDKAKLHWFQENNKIIEHRAYHTMHGIWDYFTADDGQIDLSAGSYLMIGTLITYEQIRNYYGADKVVPIYLKVNDGLRLERALAREKSQVNPKYSELCRRYLADEEDFSEDKLKHLKIMKGYDNEDIRICLSEVAAVIQKTIKEDIDIH
ncbi:guanylate kinase [Anaerocolumna cellulosilytica]|uniref:Guanylate kinase n=1 Tax=Anaerocolumna cellulosilytica TaxID=433286 RepID=A0A6S6R1W9_9FIRM|nr:guanylate kinase [Anaerocolumna cellulosilytica]MBB5195903.1 guanylate kinase [Anaerocolumna cellulosilytica]BCJ96914.1 guanylate kinase [Anaerocolumna cellulosilytica]